MFVEWQHWNNTIVLGKFIGASFKREILLACPIHELKHLHVSNWLGKSENGEVLLWFHAMWAQLSSFHRKSLRSIEKILHTQSDNGIQSVISFIWHAGGILYPHNWQRAFEKGEHLGRIVGLIGMHYNKKVNVLCHSMGSRVFEGTLRITTEHFAKSTFDTVILFSPDLDDGMEDPDFQRVCQSAEKVVVFIHRRDRFLLLSDWAHRRRRLGRSGPKGNIQSNLMLSQLTVVDMTDHIWGIQNHTHLDKAWAQQRIREALERKVSFATFSND